MREQHLVTTAWLADHLADPQLRLYDATVHLRPATPGPYTVESGRADYDAGHIPGAAFVDLATDLSDPESSLRFTMPKPGQMVAALSRVGLGNDHRVVVYSASTPMWATRLWWMLRASGHTNVQVLDGGITTWRAEGRAISTDPSVYPAAVFRAAPDTNRWADRHEVLAAIGASNVCTINALSSAMHTGDADTNYGRKGHIKGSVNVQYGDVVDVVNLIRDAGFEQLGLVSDKKKVGE